MGWLTKGREPHACPLPNPVPDDVHMGAEWKCETCKRVWELKGVNRGLDGRRTLASWEGRRR